MLRLDDLEICLCLMIWFHAPMRWFCSLFLDLEIRVYKYLRLRLYMWSALGGPDLCILSHVRLLFAVWLNWCRSQLVEDIVPLFEMPNRWWIPCIFLVQVFYLYHCGKADSNARGKRYFWYVFCLFILLQLLDAGMTSFYRSMFPLILFFVIFSLHY